MVDTPQRCEPVCLLILQSHKTQNSTCKRQNVPARLPSSLSLMISGTTGGDDGEGGGAGVSVGLAVGLGEGAGVLADVGTGVGVGVGDDVSTDEPVPETRKPICWVYHGRVSCEFHMTSDNTKLLASQHGIKQKDLGHQSKVPYMVT